MNWQATATEKDLRVEILSRLQQHSRVAWSHRMYTGLLGGHGNAKRYTIGFAGCSDIIGQLTNGQLLAIEVKTLKGNPTKDQQDFLDLVNRNGGIGFVARCAADVNRNIP
jgi:hypothetical protein